MQTLQHWQQRQPSMSQLKPTKMPEIRHLIKMGLLFRELSRHFEVSWSQSAWYQNQVSVPGKKGVTWCCEVLTDRLTRCQASVVQASRKLAVSRHVALVV